MSNTIIVTIPVQEYSENKYNGVTNEYDENGDRIRQRCYLEEALDLAGCNDAQVGGFGRTEINGSTYHTRERFNKEVIRNSFLRNEPVVVELVPLYF